jgi:hypothetical protein
MYSLTIQASNVASITNVALDTLSLNTAWVSLLANSPFLPPERRTILPRMVSCSDLLVIFRPAWNKRIVYLTRSPECHCQELLRTGRLNQAIDEVEWDRLRDVAKTDSNNRGLRFHASILLFSGDQAVGIMNIVMEN